MSDYTRHPCRPRRAPDERWISPLAWFLLGVFVVMAWGLWGA